MSASKRLYPYRKGNLPGGYMVQLAVSYGRRRMMRDELLEQARKSDLPSQRAFYVQCARSWHKMCLEIIGLMRKEEQPLALAGASQVDSCNRVPS